MRNYIREPINSLTHFIGAILSCIALIAMIIKVSFTDSSSMELTAVIIFGISMILLYTTSATYHMVISSESVLNFLQRLDHSMIFILIVGSYSPLFNCFKQKIRLHLIFSCYCLRSNRSHL